MSQEIMQAETAVAPDDYFSSPGLSQSGIKDLEVSPLRYWFKHINPLREPEVPTLAMNLGSAIHCAILEPEEFLCRYCMYFDSSSIEGLLDTKDDLFSWLKERGQIVKNSVNKPQLIEHVLSIDPGAPILANLESRHAAENHGKVCFKAEDWRRIHEAANAVRNEPLVAEILKDGCAEIVMSAFDKSTGVLLKGKADWRNSKYTVDFKTFSQTRGKSIDRSISDAIYYEKYYRQAYFYNHLEELSGLPKTTFLMVFVESNAPHETRIRALLPKHGGNVNMYWETARLEVRNFINIFSECVGHFGGKTWRHAQGIEALTDEDLPGGGTWR